MSKDDIDVVVLETLQGALQALNDVLLAQSPGVGLLAASSEEHLALSAIAPLTTNGHDLPLWTARTRRAARPIA